MQTIVTNCITASSIRYLLKLQRFNGRDIQWRESGLLRRTFDIEGSDAEQVHDFVQRWMDGPR